MSEQVEVVNVVEFKLGCLGKLLSKKKITIEDNVWDKWRSLAWNAVEFKVGCLSNLGFLSKLVLQEEINNTLEQVEVVNVVEFKVGCLSILGSLVLQ